MKLPTILLSATLLAPLPALSAPLWLTLNTASYHFDADRKYNERNLGLGLEYHQSESVLYMTGAYKNSEYRNSVYALAGWTPLEVGKVKLGVAAGVVSGYSHLNGGNFGPAAAGLIRVEGKHVGFNVLVIPPAYKDSPTTVGLQAKFNF